MIGKRRRLMSNKIDLDKVFSNAVYVTSGGSDSSTLAGATISKSLLSNDTAYYMFGYYFKNFAVFKYYNGTVIKLYEYVYNETLTLEIGTSDIKLKVGTAYNERSIGLTVLTFDLNMDNFFSNLYGDLVMGESYSSKSTWSTLLSNFYDSGTRYIFTGTSTHFCIYKLEGTTYSDLTALFNYNLYLINDTLHYDGTFVKQGYTSSATVSTLGYTRLSVKG